MGAAKVSKKGISPKFEEGMWKKLYLDYILKSNEKSLCCSHLF